MIKKDTIHNCTFSQSRLQRFLANNIEKLVLIFMLLIIFVFIISKENLNPKGLIQILLFLSILIYTFVKVQRKFAYKIVVDFESRKVRLHMHRSDAVITADFDDIKKILVNGYIVFFLKERKVFYNDLRDNELFNCLNRIMKVQWGSLCALLGPSQNVRDALMSKAKNRGHP